MHINVIKCVKVVSTVAYRVLNYSHIDDCQIFHTMSVNVGKIYSLHQLKEIKQLRTHFSVYHILSYLW